MHSVRWDRPHPEVHNAAPYRANWRQELVLTRGEADRLLEAVSTAMELAGYRPADVARMRSGLEEAVFNVFQRGQLAPEPKPIHVNYRVNEVYVVVEIQAGAACAALLPVAAGRALGGRQAGLRTDAGKQAFMTWVRYSRRDRSATVCDCHLIE